MCRSGSWAEQHTWLCSAANTHCTTLHHTATQCNTLCIVVCYSVMHSFWISKQPTQTVLTSPCCPPIRNPSFPRQQTLHQLYITLPFPLIHFFTLLVLIWRLCVDECDSLHRLFLLPLLPLLHNLPTQHIPSFPSHLFLHSFGPHAMVFKHGVATVSRIDKITGLFCRISSH